MKNLFIFTISALIALSLFSCSEKSHSSNIKQDLNTDSLYVKYKNMVSDSSNSPACVDCAAMALALSYGMDEEVAKNNEKLVKFYMENGSVPCPELLCNKENKAQLSKTK